MPEEAQTTAPAEQDTPQDAQAPEQPDTAQEESQQQSDVDWEKRYSDLRPEFDRTKQQLSEYERVLEAAQQGDPQALALLGLELEDEDEDEDDFDYEGDDEDDLRAQVAELQARLAQEDEVAQQEEYEEAISNYISDQLEECDKDLGRRFSEEEVQALDAFARVNADEQGRPDVRGAYEFFFKTLLPQQRQQWVQSKRAPQAASGQAAAHKPDLSNERERVEYMAQRLGDQEE